MTGLIDWIKQYVLRQKPSDWIKKKVTFEYWTRRDAPAFIVEIDGIRFAPLTEQEHFYVDRVELK